MNFLTSGHGGLKPTLWVILMSETPSNYTLRQDIVFCTHTCCQQLWRRKKWVQTSRSQIKVEQTHICVYSNRNYTNRWTKGKMHTSISDSKLPWGINLTMTLTVRDSKHTWFHRTQGKKQRLDLTKRLEIGWLIGHRDRNSNMEKDMKIRVNKNTVLYICKYNKSYQNKYHTLISQLIYQSGIFMNC